MQREQFIAHAELEERHWWFTGRRDILIDLLRAVAPRGAAVLDIGCGTGGNAAAFAREYHVLGLDPSSDAIQLARDRFPAVPFVETADPAAGRDHLAGGGVAVMTDVLEHVADDAQLLAQAVDVLPPGGHLILTVPADPRLWSRHDIEFGHFRRYCAADFSALWRALPVQQRLLSYFNSRLRPIISTVRRIAPDSGNNLKIPAGPFNQLLRRTFAGESGALVRAIDSGLAPYARGVSLVAVLRKP